MRMCSEGRDLPIKTCCKSRRQLQKMSDYQPVPNFEKHSAFLRAIVDMLFKTVVFGTTKQSKVIHWKEPLDLKSILDLKLCEKPVSQSVLLKLVENIIHYSIKTGHPYFINQLFSGLDAYGLAAQWVTDALNPSIYTYEVAPVFTLMEQEILHEFCEYVGYKHGDGLFCPGGSLSNGIGLNVARYHYYPDVKKRGLFHMPKLIIFTSEESHYSIAKMASFLGIGESNVIEIETDDKGCMMVKQLETAIKAQITFGNVPFVVVATLGTTVRGAFDPIKDIADLCDKYNIWLHTDAAWGGGLIFSKLHKSKLRGIERSNSIAINPHKLLAVPQQCSMLLVKDGTLLKKCHAKEAQYLFQKDKFYDIFYDCGDKYIQCGRRCDVFKFFLMWKAKGSTGFAKHVDDIMESSKFLTEIIRNRSDFKLVSSPQFVNVCFWYLPKSLRKCTSDTEYNVKLHKVASKIKELLIKEGTIMINYQPLKQFPNFFRFVSQNSAFTKEDATYLVNKIAEKGEGIVL